MYREQLARLMAADTAAQPSRSSSSTATVSDPAPSQCALYAAGAAQAPASSCASCHRGTYGVNHTHPVDVDYEGARYRARTTLRPAQEVVKRGVFLPGGMVQCGTCHDSRSPWKFHLALPPGAPARMSMAYTGSGASERSSATGAGNSTVPGSAAVTPPAGSAVSPTPLCLACHGFD